MTTPNQNYSRPDPLWVFGSSGHFAYGHDWYGRTCPSPSHSRLVLTQVYRGYIICRFLNHDPGKKRRRTPPWPASWEYGGAAVTRLFDQLPRPWFEVRANLFSTPSVCWCVSYKMYNKFEFIVVSIRGIIFAWEMVWGVLKTVNCVVAVDGRCLFVREKYFCVLKVFF